MTPPAAFTVSLTDSIDQMIGPVSASSTDAALLIPLGAADAAEMLALADMTRPGPFNIGTQEFGGFNGIRVDGRLVAMAGERMRLDGFTEISAVCVHPDYRGRGYAADLIAAVSRAISARGEMPFLHVFSGNKPAIALYRKLGLSFRRKLRLTVLQRTGEP